ncbi:MAG: class I SAM-dependent methyltransferase [Candidatus Eremiobacteraeota bacterium]|nr:class I SAM-dependent methyltransferase [Candidatus Eremiobacteraeota bacterium]
MTEQEFTSIAHQKLTWNSPLSPSHADELIVRLPVAAGDIIVDLGCGWGEFLLRTLRQHPDTTGIGLDISADNVRRAMARANELGMQSRVHFKVQDASNWAGHGDVFLCIGSAYIWKGPVPLLRALSHRAKHVLLGEGYWAQSPTPEVVTMIGAGLSTLAELSDLCASSGFRPLHVTIADQYEWDTFESDWRAGLEIWASRQNDSCDARRARELSDVRRNEYLRGYRGILGFAYLMLSK